MKKNSEEFTLKDLLVDPTANLFTDAFGIERKRGTEITDKLNTMWEVMRKEATWSAKGIFIEASLQGLALNAREVAFVTYLIGCRIGEDTVYQDAVDIIKKIPVPRIPTKKNGGNGHVN